MKTIQVETLDSDIAYNIKALYYIIAPHRAEEYCELFTPRKFTFGKYKETNIGYICLIDKQYIEWLLDNTNFSLTEKEYLLYKPDSIMLSEGGFKEISRGCIEEFHNCGSVNWEILNTLATKY